MSRWLLQKQKRLALQASGGLRSEQPQGMALKEWTFATRLWCSSNGWIDHVCRWFSALWRSVLCHLAGPKALQKRPAEAKGGSSENGWALAQGYSPSVAQSEDSFSSQGWSRKRSQVGDIQDRCTCCLNIYALPISREGLQPLETWNCQSFDSSFCHRHLLDLRRWAQRWRWMRSPLALACQRVSCLQMRPRGGMSLGGSKVDGDGCSCRLASCKIFIYWWRWGEVNSKKLDGSLTDTVPVIAWACLGRWSLGKQRSSGGRTSEETSRCGTLGSTRVLWYGAWGNMCFCNGFSIVCR